MRGAFIAFEGIDGSGKTTQLELLAARAKERGLDVLVVREPGGTQLGEQIRDILLDKANSGLVRESEALLYAASRAQLIQERIKPALEAGTLVLADRFWGSTLAYQGAGRGLDQALLKQANALAVDGVLPDLTVLLRIERTVAESRRAGTEADRLEQAGDAFFDRVVTAYDALAAREPDWVVVDATLPPDTIAAEIARHAQGIVERGMAGV